MDRVLDAMPHDPREATINLIDALREYVRSQDALGHELLEQQSITVEELNKWRFGNNRARYVSLLAELQAYEMDDTLNGLLPWKERT